MNNEREKIQLEIAELLLERERILLGLPKVVNNRGGDPAAVAGAAKSVFCWLLCIALGGVVGTILGALMGAIFVLLKVETLCPAYPDADFLYRVGCTLGADENQLLLGGGLGLLTGLYQGHKIFRRS